MALTPAQQQTLRTDIQTLGAPGQPLNAMYTAQDWDGIAGFYNTVGTFVVWKTTLKRSDITDTTSLDADGATPRAFDWASAGGYIARAQGERDAFAAIFNAADNCKPSLPNVRSAFDDIFSGNGVGAVANRNHIKNVSRRNATALEKLLATGTGTAASPATMSFEGSISGRDILDIHP